MFSTLAQLKSSAITPLLSWLLAGPISFAVMQLQTNDTTLAVVVGACSAFAAAFFASVPKIISARREARSSDAATREAANTKLIERMQAFQRLEVANLKSTNADLKQENILVRTTKHSILNELQSSILRIRTLEHLLDENKIAHECYQVPTIADIFAYEDEELKKISHRAGEAQREAQKVAADAATGLTSEL